ncbi:MAG: hypothetical protein DBY35_06595 [Bacteroidales bacterium]|nr:MAG: hypothetical protein DBY35_06595 [Bacteroidales bacterium]
MTANEAFDGYLSSLPNNIRIAKTRDLRFFLDISSYVIHDWRIGRTRIRPIYQREISKIVGEDIFRDVIN